MGGARHPARALGASLLGITLWFTACQSGSGDRCTPASPCTDGKACQAGRCVDACRAAPECEAQGRCTRRHGKCVVASDADCKRARICNGFTGLCTALEGQCVPRNAADCAAAPQCAFDGRCSFADGACVAATALACVDSTLCGDEALAERHRTCILDQAKGRCTACEGTEACAQKGHCGLRLRGTTATCVPCAESDLCARGFCRALRGRCVNVSGDAYAGTRLPRDAVDPRVGSPAPETIPKGPDTPVPAQSDGKQIPNGTEGDDSPPPGTIPVAGTTGHGQPKSGKGHSHGPAAPSPAAAQPEKKAPAAPTSAKTKSTQAKKGSQGAKGAGDHHHGSQEAAAPPDLPPGTAP